MRYQAIRVRLEKGIKKKYPNRKKKTLIHATFFSGFEVNGIGLIV